VAEAGESDRDLAGLCDRLVGVRARKLMDSRTAIDCLHQNFHPAGWRFFCMTTHVLVLYRWGRVESCFRSRRGGRELSLISHHRMNNQPRQSGGLASERHGDERSD
jgi:hypothetical protein